MKKVFFETLKGALEGVFRIISIEAAVLMLVALIYNSKEILAAGIVYQIAVLVIGIIVAIIYIVNRIKDKQEKKQKLELLLSEAPTVDIFTELSEEERLKADLNADITQTLYDFRRGHGLTTKEFANMLGISEEAVISMEYLEENFEFMEN